MSGPLRSRTRASGSASLILATVVLALTGAAALAAGEVPGGGGPLQPSAATVELRSHIPDAVAADCADGLPVEPQEREGSLARVLCTTSDQSTIHYELFDSLDAMDRAFQGSRSVALMFGHDQLADTCAEGWYEGIWYLGDEGVAGRLLCEKTLYGEAPAIVLWSHPATRIVSFIRETDGDAEAAFDLWIAAGPN